MFVIDVGWYLAHYANLICLNIEDDRSQSMPTHLHIHSIQLLP